MSSPLSSESVFRGGLGGVGTAQSTYGRPSGRAQTPPQAPHGPLCSALSRYGTTFRESISKMVASGASSQAPEGLSLQRELDFHFQQGSHLGAHFGSILEPKGVQVLYDARPGGTHGSIWVLVEAQALRLSATSGGSCAKSGYSWP